MLDVAEPRLRSRAAPGIRDWASPGTPSVPETAPTRNSDRVIVFDRA